MHLYETLKGHDEAFVFNNLIWQQVCVLYENFHDTMFLFVAFQEVWISVYCLSWTPESGGPGWISDGEGSTCQSC